MENENLYTMKQPELGKRILALRKSKGFTQEELVEKCNINVRTIQRIEAGEVSPRNFTLRTILEALGVDADAFFGPSIHEKATVTLSNEQSNQLQLSWIGGIFFTVFAMLGVVVETMIWDYEDPIDGELVYLSIYGILTLVSLFFFMRGYKILGDLLNNKLLSAATYVYFFSEVLLIVSTIVFTVFQVEGTFAEVSVGLPVLIVIGIAELLMGIGILRLREQLGDFAFVIGIMKVINGVLFMSVILSVVAIFLVFPILIMELVFLYLAHQKLSK
jgi:transcriptional regulator with XRE-family HTH domain